MNQKIAVVLPQEEPFSPDTGGALATWVFEVYNKITNFSPTVFTPQAKRYYDISNKFIIRTKYSSFFGKLVPVKAISILLKSSYYPLVVAIYCKVLSIKIIHIHNRPSYVLIFRKLLPNAKIILHMQNDHILHYPKIISEKSIMKVDEIISTSEYIERGIKDFISVNSVLFNGRFNVLYNGANKSKFKILNIEKRFASMSVLFVGRLVPEKGVRELINAFILVLKEMPEAKLNIIGGHHFGSNEETHYIRELKLLAEPYLKNIKFLGHVGHDQIPEYFNSASIFVCPSIWNDPFPLAVIEGMAAGLPVISSNRGGIPEELKDTGLLIEPENSQIFAREIMNLLNSKENQINFGRAARLRFEENFTWDKIANGLENTLKKIVCI